MMMPNCLGKLPPAHDRRTLYFERYTVASSLPKPPAHVDWLAKATNWGMMRNDSVGDCAIVGPAHQVQAWSAANGNQQIITDSDVIAAYSAVSGYDPATGAHDNGCIMLDVMKYWKNVGIGGHKIGAFLAINPRDLRSIQVANWLFGGLCLGLSLPVAAQRQSVWSLPKFGNMNVPVGWLGPQWQPGSWGGHTVLNGAIDGTKNLLTFLTWGEKQVATTNWFLQYCDEAYVALSTDWVDGTKPAPSGFDMATLKADLAAL